VCAAAAPTKSASGRFLGGAWGLLAAALEPY
jgi:hypothetical protein